MHNQGACKRNMPRSTIQEIHKSNYKLTNIGSSRLYEQVPIQRRSVWYFNPTNNSLRNIKSGYSTKKDSFSFIFKGSDWYNEQNQNHMCPVDCIKSVKLFWWVLFYEYIHREIDS